MRIIALSALTLAILAACSKGEESVMPNTTAASDASQPMNNEPEQASAATAEVPQQTSTGMLPQDDAEALGVLSEINQHEIAAAQQAQGRQLTPKVSDYAAMMIKDHTENDAEIQKLGVTANSQPVMAQKTKGEAELAALGEHKDGYPKAYIDAMVKGHTDTLKTLDEEIMPQARSAEAKSHLEKTRVAVTHHLDQAKALQSSL